MSSILWLNVLLTVSCTSDIIASAEQWYATRMDRLVVQEAADVLSTQAAHSARHCAFLCNRHSDCTASNYHHATSQCQLLKPATIDHVQQTGSTAIFRRASLFTGQIGMWPLNQEHQGANLVPGKTAINLYDVIYPNPTQRWQSPPVWFSGEWGSYGRATSVVDVKPVSGSFAFIAYLYLEVANGAVFDWSISSHIWVKEGIINVHVGCYWEVYAPSVVSLEKWHTLAVAYDADTAVLSTWLDGVVQETPDICVPEFSNAQYGNINFRGIDTRRVRGHMTCMALYDRSMAYDDMYATTTALCGLN